MRHSAFMVTSSFLGLIVGSSVAMGAVYDEAVDGDLSNDRFAPTLIGFDSGLNTVSMFVVDSDNLGGDRDYFTFSIGAGQFIDSIVITESYNPNDGFDATSFLGLAFDNYFDFDPVTFMGDGLEGYVIAHSSEVGVEQITTFSGGLSTLGAGDYSFWVQQGGVDLTRVSLAINVVPAPNAMALLGLGGIASIRRRR